MSRAVQPNYTKIYLIFFESRVKRHPVKCQYIGVFFATAAKEASKEEVVVWCAQTYEGYNRVNVLAYCVQLNCNLRFLSCWWLAIPSAVFIEIQFIQIFDLKLPVILNIHPSESVLLKVKGQLWRRWAYLEFFRSTLLIRTNL